VLATDAKFDKRKTQTFLKGLRPNSVELVPL
jgi:hypothetical protein